MSSRPLKFPDKAETDVRVLEDAIIRIVEAIALTPAEVRVTPRRDSSKGFVLNIEVASQDLGRVVGKGGNVARAIRQYVSAFETEHGGHYRLTFARRTQGSMSARPGMDLQTASSRDGSPHQPGSVDDLFAL